MLLSLIAAAALVASPAASLADAPAAGAPAWCAVPVAEASGRAGPVAARLARRLDEPPHAAAHVHTEHTLSGDPLREASLEAERDLPLMRDAALAWRAGAGDRYGVFAARHLSAWLAAYEPDLNPIDETNFDALIETYALLRPASPTQKRAGMDRWFRGWAQAYVDAMDRNRGARRGSWTNNWQSHRVKLVAMAAAAIDDPKLFDEARRLYWDQVEVNIAPSGEVLDFSERDALHYVVYDLEPLLQAALAARARGEDWWGARKPGGPSIEAAVRWLEPYAAGEKTHQEFARSTVAFDAERARHGEKGFSGAWDPSSAARLYWMAAEFDPTYRALAAKLNDQPPVNILLCGQ
jgi:hypothetical protein